MDTSIVRAALPTPCIRSINVIMLKIFFYEMSYNIPVHLHYYKDVIILLSGYSQEKYKYNCFWECQIWNAAIFKVTIYNDTYTCNEKYISNLVHTAHFCNNLHKVHCMLQGFNIFQVFQVLHYLQVVLFIKIETIFIKCLIQYSLKSGGTKDHFRWVIVPGTAPTPPRIERSVTHSLTIRKPSHSKKIGSEKCQKEAIRNSICYWLIYLCKKTLELSLSVREN
jgi:hypothetical protein